MLNTRKRGRLKSIFQTAFCLKTSKIGSYPPQPVFQLFSQLLQVSGNMTDGGFIGFFFRQADSDAVTLPLHVGQCRAETIHTQPELAVVDGIAARARLRQFF